MTHYIDSIEEFHSLLDYYISCLEKEERLTLNFDYRENNKKFYSNIFKKEQFFLQKKEQIEIKKTPEIEGIFKDYKLNYKDVPISYGYPLFMDSNGKVSPVFHIEIFFDEKDDALIFTKGDINPEFNHYILSKHDYCIEEINKIRSEIDEEKDFSIKLNKIAKLLNLDEKAISPEIEQKPMIVTNSPQLINKAILYFGGKIGFTKGLVDELRELKKRSKNEIESTSLGFLFGKEKVNDKEEPKELLEVFNLNESQEKGVKEAFSNDISVITGPPGTGKSQVVLNIIANAVWNDKTVLFASKNNQAVNVVNDKLRGVLSKDLVIRMGSSNYRKKAKLQIQRIFQEKDSIKLSSAFEEDTEKLRDCIKNIGKLKAKIRNLSRLNGDIISYSSKISQLNQSIPEDLNRIFHEGDFYFLNNLDIENDEMDYAKIKSQISNIPNEIKRCKLRLASLKKAHAEDMTKIAEEKVLIIKDYMLPIKLLDYCKSDIGSFDELEFKKQFSILFENNTRFKNILEKLFSAYYLNKKYKFLREILEPLEKDIQKYLEENTKYESGSIKKSLILLPAIKKIASLTKEEDRMCSTFLTQKQEISNVITKHRAFRSILASKKQKISDKYCSGLSGKYKKTFCLMIKKQGMKTFLSHMKLEKEINLLYVQIESIKKQLLEHPSFYELKAEIDNITKKKIEISRGIFENYWFKKLKQTSARDETHVSRYIDASEKLEKYIDDYSLWKELVEAQRQAIQVMLSFLPVWIVTNLSAKNSLPLKEKLFDLLIIDEASQCDIASALPLFYRAKKVVIIGDPKQLKHISLLEYSKDKKIASENKVSKLYLDYAYSKNSLYDISERTIKSKNKHPTLLNQHYRSHKEIINFSNEHFYDKQLDIMTDEDKLISNKAYPAGIHWVDVKGNTQSLHNNEEANKVINIIKGIRDNKVSVGVVTLFKNQMELITEQIKKTEELKELNIKVGTAHGFQGDEKDIIIFSPAISQNIKQATLNWVHTTTQLLNVAITRAKSILIIVGDKDKCQGAGGILKELADYCIPKTQKEINFESPIEHKLYKRLESDKIRFHYQYDINIKGSKFYRLDFALFVNKNKYDIEIDGDKAHSQKIEYDSLRDTHLRLEGWKIRRFRAVDIQNNIDKVMEEIKRLC